METTNERNDSFFERFFQLSKNGTNVKTEVLAGFTTFITVAYALLVIPNILKFSGMNALGAKGDAAASIIMANDPIVSSAYVGTCIASALGTLIMSFYANLPFALAPGLGLVSFFSYSVCIKLGYTWQQGLAAVLISGILFIIITVTSIREQIVDSLPENLKLAITGGIGLFVALIGLKSGGIVVANPGTLVGFGSFTDKHVILTLVGIVVIAILIARNVKGAMLIGIIITTIIGIPMGITKLSGASLFSIPTMGKTFMAYDFKGLLSHGGTGFLGAVVSILMVIITLSLVDLFDTIGTLVGTAQKSNMIEADGRVRNMRKALFSDAVGTTIASGLGTTTLATVVESAAGIAAGGRTGLTTLVVGVLFAVSVFFSGVVGIVPAEATSPALVIVGILMMGAVKKIDFDDFTEALPAFFTIAFMPFSYSIANGVAAGIIFYPIMKIVTGRRKEVHPIMYVMAFLFILRFILLPE
ncbi:NCS2 family permease [Clostridium sp. MB40-C1]|uniref:NCS2 family permease n=1 Tax=Clostridium sp. MB40-C1 TaxID=3070996 RepID=UPI0027DF3375|nr:NCS2 family permease [Clostridium sp. MB40-C1]WMJ81408.1 NCS2 family permease [Clostridium sp. MB40-C1]